MNLRAPLFFLFPFLSIFSKESNQRFEGLLFYVAVERVGGHRHVEVLFAEPNRRTAFLVCLVAGYDHSFSVGSDKDDDRRPFTLIAAYVACHSAAGRYQVGEMLHGIVFGGVAETFRLAVNLDERVLLPAPRTFTVVLKNEVPNEVFVAAAADIVAQKMECVLACFPVHRAVAAFTLARDEVEGWIGSPGGWC